MDSDALPIPSTYVRLETCRMANARNSGSIAGLEVLAFGTALKLLNAP